MGQIYNSQILNEEWQNELSHLDFLFLAVGSDYRAYEALRLAKENGVTIGKVILFEFEERVATIDQEQKDAAEKYTTIDYEYFKIECSIKNPSLALKTLQGGEDIDISSESQIGVDISCFTKPYYFTLLQLIKQKYEVPEIAVFYTEPNSYLFDKGLYQLYSSSTGPVRVEEIPSFNGNDLGSDHNILVAMLGFDGDLSTEINEEVAPKKIMVINGFPSYTPKFKDISLISNEKLVNGTNNKLLYCRANNPFEAYNLLEEIRNKNKTAHINVAPLGTKPMALGVCIFAIHHPEVRVIYPMPENFNNVTTDNCWNTWYYGIHLST